MYFNCTISIFITLYSVFSLSEIFSRNATLKSKLNSWFSRDVTKIQTKKLSLLLSLELLSCGISAPLNLYTNKFLVQNGSLFCDTGCLNFQVFT